MVSSSFVKIACVVVIAMTVAPPAAEALTCRTVSGYVTSCINYARVGRTGPPGCCNGIKNLNSLAKTSQDRRDACKCLKSAATTIKRLNLGLVAGLPGKCRVNVPFKISPSTNCNT